MPRNLFSSHTQSYSCMTVACIPGHLSEERQVILFNANDETGIIQYAFLIFNFNLTN